MTMLNINKTSFLKDYNSFFSFLFFVLKRCLKFIVKISVWNIAVKSNPSSNEFESDKVDCRMCLVQRKIRQGRLKKQGRKKW